MNEKDTHILDALYAVLQTRKGAAADESYVASLYAGGAAKIAEKIAEEAAEVNAEGVRLDQSPEDADTRAEIKKALVHEAADLLFHLSVMLAHHDVPPEEVFAELEGRFGTSGHIEKANRGQ